MVMSNDQRVPQIFIISDLIQEEVLVLSSKVRDVCLGYKPLHGQFLEHCSKSNNLMSLFAKLVNNSHQIRVPFFCLLATTGASCNSR